MHYAKELSGKEKNISDSPESLTTLKQARADWSALEVIASKACDNSSKQADTALGLGAFLKAMSEQYDAAGCDSSLSAFLTAFSAANNGLHAEHKEAASLVRAHLIDPARIFTAAVARDTEQSASKFASTRLEYDTMRSKVLAQEAKDAAKLVKDAAKAAAAAAKGAAAPAEGADAEATGAAAAPPPPPADPDALSPKLVQYKSAETDLATKYVAQKADLETKITLLEDKSRREMITNMSKYVKTMQAHHARCGEILSEVLPLLEAAQADTHLASQQLINAVSEATGQ